MLLRNMIPSRGLCNGTRLLTKNLHDNFIDSEILSGTHNGHCVFIPQIDLSPSDSRLPFILKRRQFPIIPAFVITINKSQGQTFDNVGLFLPEPVFSHANYNQQNFKASATTMEIKKTNHIEQNHQRSDTIITNYNQRNFGQALQPWKLKKRFILSKTIKDPIPLSQTTINDFGQALQPWKLKKRIILSKTIDIPDECLKI
ncbi:uncharacterized protein LOC135930121 [Gordionus sp. m RMFG-2023]|uniref:uncharacterized protein LOC135930121 n=1 Tax=Gordionus sp. m RMFG-2023 TaxID=3053472 RepID=UPI0031FBB9DD